VATLLPPTGVLFFTDRKLFYSQKTIRLLKGIGVKCCHFTEPV